MKLHAKSTWRASPPVLARSECSLCRGTGWQLVSACGSRQARRCSCSALHRLMRLRQDVRIPPQYHHCSLDEYHPENMSQAVALAEAQRFADRFPRVDRGLFFLGGAGAGKTHLAVGVMLRLLQRFHEDLLFLDCRELESASCDGHSGRQHDRAAVCSLLVLDNFSGADEDADRATAAWEPLKARLAAGRITLLTSSGSFSIRRFSTAQPLGRNGAQECSGAGRPVPAMRFLGNFKILRMHAEDRSGAFPLFSTPGPEPRGHCA